MHVKTYLALLEEYWQLAMLEDEALTAMIAQFDTLTRPRRVNVRAEWQRLKAQRKQPLALLRAAAQRASWRDSVAATEPAEKRVTLGELAKQARVPYAFAKEAAQTPLLRPDQGRTTRRKRYRRGLARWLNKLYQLRTAGMTWNEIEAWTKRRWQPGRDHERYWPRDYG